MMRIPNLDPQQLAAFCRRHRIATLEVFGSRARGDARPDSDLDLLVTFEPGYNPGLAFFGLAAALSELCGVEVDLLTRRTVESDLNPIFRTAVLETVEPIYAA